MTFIIGGCFALILFLSQAINPIRRSAGRASDLNSMKQIGLGIWNHQGSYGDFPSNRIDKTGKPILSWRVAITPFIMNTPINRKLPWDSVLQQNDKNAHAYSDVFQTYTGFEKTDNHWETNIISITGKGTVWDYSKPVKGKTFSDASATIILMEVPSLGVHWMEPWDLDVNDFLHLRSKIFDPEPLVYAVCYADGGVASLNFDQIMKLTKEDFMIKRGSGDE